MPSLCILAENPFARNGLEAKKQKRASNQYGKKSLMVTLHYRTNRDKDNGAEVPETGNTEEEKDGERQADDNNEGGKTDYDKKPNGIQKAENQGYSFWKIMKLA